MMAAEKLSDLLPLPGPLAASLSERGFETATPIQAAVLPRAHSGESLIVHSETGSGKTLAMLLPALCKPGLVLMLSPSRELCVQLQDEARVLLEALEESSTVALVAQGYKTTPTALLDARVVIATPAEFCELVARGTDANGSGESNAAGVFAETLGSTVSTLILDEVDALVPGKKDFRGKRHGKWMDKGMHPAEAVVKLLAKRSTREDFQMIAGSATLDQSTRRKISKLLRSSKVLQAKGAPRSLPLVTTAAGTSGLEDDEQSDDEDAESNPTRWTAVPDGIEHRRMTLPRFDGLGGTEPACEAVLAVAHDHRLLLLEHALEDEHLAAARRLSGGQREHPEEAEVARRVLDGRTPHEVADHVLSDLRADDAVACVNGQSRMHLDVGGRR